MIDEREEIEVGEEYGPGSAERVIQKSREGDRFRLERLGKGYPDIDVVVVDCFTDEATVRGDGGEEYVLHQHLWVNLRSGPWLRTAGESRGQVESLTVLRLGESKTE
jgi:hypothetical protein